ncbi:hypothetical protein [Candidatus Magnetominusculus xianensis]|nr:hypothetical protein [Candidatus Magnetominusculus xianensis]MBF0405031.1 hypothetical protein [Nitrospirota bacterium]
MPELSAYYKNMHFTADNPYYYVSIFANGPYFLPMLILPLLYLLHPSSPMHMYAIVIVVFTIGAPGIYLTIRILKGSKAMSLIGAMGYCILPQMEHTVFHFGQTEAISYAFIPYVFASLFAKKWKLFYLSVFLISLISIPYTYVAMIIGVTVAVLFKAPLQGGISFLISVLTNFYSSSVMKQSLCGISSDYNSFSILKKSVIDYVGGGNAFYKIELLDQAVYMYITLITIAFLPVFGIRKQGKWNYHIIGLIIISFGDAFINTFRLTGWYSHRTAGWVIPLYLAAFMVCTDKSEGELSNTVKPQFYQIAKMILFASVISMTLWTTLRYPWVGLNSFLKTGISHKMNDSRNVATVLTPLNNTVEIRKYLDVINSIVPQNVSVAYLENIGLANYLVNRKDAWEMDYGFPDGVEYYVISYINTNAKRKAHGVNEKIEELKQGKNSELLFNHPYLEIYKNKNPKPIPRLETALQWDILLHPWKTCDK